MFRKLLTALAMVVISTVSVTAVPAHAATATLTINGHTYQIGPNADLRGADLHGADLSYLNLSGADFTAANLSFTRMEQTNLSNAIVVESNLQNVIFRYTDAIGVDFSTATLFGASGNVSGMTLPSGWTSCSGYIVGPGANIANIDLSYCNLSNVDLTSIRSGGLTHYQFGSSYPTLPEGWALLGGYLLGPTADLTGAYLDSVDLSNLDLSNANFTRLHASRITGVNLFLPSGWKRLAGYLVGPKANLQSDNFSTVDFGESDLTGAVLTNANLGGADLSKSTLKGIIASHLQGGFCGKLPTGFTCDGGWILGAEMGITSGVFEQLKGRWNDFPGLDISNTDFTGGASVVATKFHNANLSHTNVHGSFVGCDFTDSTFFFTNIDQVDFSSSNFSGVRSKDVTGTPQNLPANWRLIGGLLVGPKANLQGSDISGLALAEADLTGVKGGPIVGTPSSLPSEWSIIDTFLVGPGVDLSGANLTNADLSSANLSGATLDGTDLTNATLPSGSVSGIVGTPLSLPAGYILEKGNLLRQLSADTNAQMQGVTRFGNQLTANIIGNPDKATYSVIWSRDNMPLSGVSGTTYQLKVPDIGHYISFTVVFEKIGYKTLSITSSPRMVTAAQMILKQVPKIKGTARVGNTLSAVAVKEIKGATLSYQWLLDGKAIKGQIKSSLKLLAPQRGHKISVKVTHALAGHTPAYKTSVSVKVG
jgi:uncharacterized protein YjbI with pentapeptide repeats